MFRGARLLLTLVLGLALVGCTHYYRPRPMAAGIVTLTADLEGYAPDQPGWVFVVAPWDYVPGGSEGPFDLVLTSALGSKSWQADPTAMALLPENADFFASGTKNTPGVVIVYQAPYDSLGAARLVSRKFSRTIEPIFEVDAGLSPLPPRPTQTGAASIPRTPVGQTVEFGDCAVRIDKAVYSDRVGGYKPKDDRFLAVTLTVTPSKDAWSGSLFKPGLVSHPSYINKPDALATALANPIPDAFNTRDGPVTATIVFDVVNDERPYLIFTDSKTNYIRFDLGLSIADSAPDIAPNQPLTPLGQAASFREMTATVQRVAVVTDVVVLLSVTNHSIYRQWAPSIYLLDGDGHLVKPRTNSNPFDKWLAENESVTGSLNFKTDAPKGSRLLLWHGGFGAPVQMSLWPA